MYKKTAAIFLIEWLVLGIILATKIHTYSVFQFVFESIQRHISNSTLASFIMLLWLTLPQAFAFFCIVYIRQVKHKFNFLIYHVVWVIVTQLIFYLLISK